MERCSYPPPPPSPSDDLRPLPPAAVAESQWGEPRSGAFGTGARVAGSVSLWPVLLPLVGKPLVLAVLEAVNPDLAPLGMSGWRRGKRGRAGVECLSIIKSTSPNALSMPKLSGREMAMATRGGREGQSSLVLHVLLRNLAPHYLPGDNVKHRWRNSDGIIQLVDEGRKTLVYVESSTHNQVSATIS